LTHDIDHPGWANGYEMSTLSSLALLHNDDAVLERHHAATFSKIFFDSAAGTHLLGDKSNPEARKIRRLCVKAILGTDMSRHFSGVKNLGERISVNKSVCIALPEAWSALHTSENNITGSTDSYGPVAVSEHKAAFGEANVD